MMPTPKAMAKAASPINAKTVWMNSQELWRIGLRFSIFLGSMDEVSIRTKTSGIMNEPSNPIRYRYSRKKKSSTMHQAKKEDASWRLAVGICPDMRYRARILAVCSTNPATTRPNMIREVVLVPLNSSRRQTIVAAK
jgi:hypothetical protein